METPKIWLEIAIAGFVYVAAAFFALLSWLNIYDLSSLSNSREFAPYLSVAIILLSYLIGLSVHIAMYHGYYKLRKARIWLKIFKWLHKDQEPEHSEDDEDLAFRDDISPRVLEHMKATYNTFILFRLLAVGTPLLCVSLVFWMSNTEYTHQRLPTAATLILLTALFAFSYLSLRPSQSKLKKHAYKSN